MIASFFIEMGIICAELCWTIGVSLWIIGSTGAGLTIVSDNLSEITDLKLSKTTKKNKQNENDLKKSLILKLKNFINKRLMDGCWILDV